jgi:hypothetical protein
MHSLTGADLQTQCPAVQLEHAQRSAWSLPRLPFTIVDVRPGLLTDATTAPRHVRRTRFNHLWVLRPGRLLDPGSPQGRRAILVLLNPDLASKEFRVRLSVLRPGD